MSLQFRHSAFLLPLFPFHVSHLTLFMHPCTMQNNSMRYFLLTILALSLACSKHPTSPDTFSLSGTVHLEGQEDHSGVVQ
jgi:hypothetical protein